MRRSTRRAWVAFAGGLALWGTAFLTGTLPVSATPRGTTYPYPINSPADLFAAGSGLAQEGQDAVGQADHPTLDISSKAFGLHLGNGTGTAVNPAGLTALLIRAQRSSGTLAVWGNNQDTKKAVTLTTSGKVATGSSATIAAKTSQDFTLGWNFGNSRERMSKLTLQAAYDKGSRSQAFYVARLDEGDAFDLNYAVGDTQPAAFQTVALNPADGSEEDLELGVLAASTDLLWLRVNNWGSNLITVEGTGVSKDTVLFPGTNATVTGLSRVYPGFAQQLKSDAISGDPTYTLTLQGSGGYDHRSTHNITLLVKRYAERFPISRVNGAEMTAITLDLPADVTGEIPESLDAGTLEPVSDKYLPLVKDPIAAVSLRMIPQGTPTATWVQPVLVNWEISRTMLEKTLTSADAAAFLEELAASSEKLTTFFTRVRPYKHFPSQVVDLLTLANATGNREAFFTVASDPATGKATLTFRLLVADSGTPEVTTILEDGIGYFLVSDGVEDGVLEDPLCLCASNSPPPTVAPTARPTGATPTGGGGSSSGGGCNAGTTVWGLLLALPLLLLRRRG